MKSKQNLELVNQSEKPSTGNPNVADRSRWQEPRLKFMEPKLTERGSVKDLTGGFFGTFRP